MLRSNWTRLTAHEARRASRQAWVFALGVGSLLLAATLALWNGQPPAESLYGAACVVASAVAAILAAELKVQSPDEKSDSWRDLLRWWVSGDRRLRISTIAVWLLALAIETPRHFPAKPRLKVFVRDAAGVSLQGTPVSVTLLGDSSEELAYGVAQSGEIELELTRRFWRPSKVVVSAIGVAGATVSDTTTISSGGNRPKLLTLSDPRDMRVTYYEFAGMSLAR